MKKNFHERIYFEDIEEIIETIVGQIHKPYTSDVTDKVFVAIEKNPEFLRLYNLYCGGNYNTINPMIGKYVKEITGLHVKGRCHNPRSNLIKSYAILEN